MPNTTAQQSAPRGFFGAKARPVLLLMLGVLAFLESPARAQLKSEHRDTALFLYNLAKFFEWPADLRGNTILIGIAGDDFLATALDEVVKGKTANSRSIDVKRVQSGLEARDCHILFLSSRNRQKLRAALIAVKGASVLTVSDLGDFSKIGGVVEVETRSGRQRFVVNIEAAELAGLKVSSRLLSLSNVVRGGGR